MFNESKYTKWYFNTINKAKFSEPIGYSECHHIIPKSCGGSNEKDNLVKLTAKEHFVCHHLLTKMMVSTEHQIKMNRAFWRMIYWHKQRMTAKKYHIMKSTYDWMAAGENNSFYGRKHSEESKEKNRKAHLGHTYLKGIPKSDDHKKAISLSKLGKKQTEKQIAWKKIKFMGEGNPMYGKQQSDETKRKISEAHKKDGKFKGAKNPNAKKFKVMDKFGNEYVTECLRDFCQEKGLSYDPLYMTSKRPYKTRDGWKAVQII